jgi:hypothetical protein
VLLTRTALLLLLVLLLGTATTHGLVEDAAA